MIYGDLLSSVLSAHGLTEDQLLEGRRVRRESEAGDSDFAQQLVFFPNISRAKVALVNNLKSHGTSATTTFC